VFKNLTKQENTMKKLNTLSKLAFISAALVASLSAVADTKVYSYKTFTSSGKVGFAELKIENDGGVVSVQVLTQTPSICIRGKVPAEVSTDAEVTTYTLVPALKDCQGTRMVIKNDGTGGRVELKEGDAWVVRNVTQDYLVLKK
jgi:hypothetical protein